MPDRQYQINPGDRYGRWTVIALAPSRRGGPSLHARCDCGKEKLLFQSSLVSGASLSCGCLRRELFSTADGLSHTKTYQTWRSMLSRASPFTTCAASRRLYAGTGITVCERWKGLDGFYNFLADMGEKPPGRMNLDRYPDPHGNYEPGNCRWATYTQQMRNRRDNHVVDYKGITVRLIDACEACGYDYRQVLRQIYARRLTTQEVFERYLAGFRPKTINKQPYGTRQRYSPLTT